MANQTISVNTNHDEATGRNPGEDFTITSGATLTIDSMPHLTPSGILGDITISDGTLHIDGTRTFEIAYSGGSGSLPSVLSGISWNGGTDTGKIIALNSGDNISGVLTITKDAGTVTPDDADSITDGSWSADVDSVKVGYLMVFGEDQDWGSVDGRSTLRVNGDWYELGVGDGTDSQVFTLPHTGHQPAIWVETGDGTGVFQIWHRIVPTASTVYWNNINQFGPNFESGFVFDQSFGSATVTFGTSTAGGVPPLGARIRIPNVHIGTTTLGNPSTEVSSSILTEHIGIIAPNTNLNVEIDHLNGSSCYIDFRGTNAVTVSSSCWGMFTSGTSINKVNAPVTLDNCAIIAGGAAGDYLPSLTLTITDNIGGVTLNDCVIMTGPNANNRASLVLITMANISFTGTCKLVSNQQDENTMYALRATTASNLTAETLIALGGPISAAAGSNNWEIDELIYGLPPGRGTTEQNIFNALISSASSGCLIKSGRLAVGAKHGTNNIFSISDSDNITIRNFGSVLSKIDGEARATSVFNLSGITTNCLFQRIYYTNLNSSQFDTVVNSVADITFENCGGDYNDEIELDGNRIIAKGIHGASGAPDSATGVEGDNINCLATIFHDYFKSDDTGAIGLQFNDRGQKHLNDVTIVSGTPVWNGLGDLLMRTVGDQVIYEWPYLIKGHTGFQDAAVQLSATGGANLSYEYDLDTGSGYSGSWKEINGTNLSAETVSPSGFRFKVRMTCTTGSNTNAIKGFAVLTTTTLADQAANLYSIAKQVKTTLSGLKPGTEVRVYLDDNGDNGLYLAGVESSGTSFEFTLEENTTVNIIINNLNYLPADIWGFNNGSSDSTVPISQFPDRQYLNV